MPYFVMLDGEDSIAEVSTVAEGEAMARSYFANDPFACMTGFVSVIDDEGEEFACVVQS